MTAEQLRKTAGGVVGCFTPKEIVCSIVSSATGDIATGLKVPAGKLIIGAYIKNLKDDVASSGSATAQIKIGSTSIGSEIAKADLKGKAVYVPVTTYDGTNKDTAPSAIATTAETEVKVTVGTAVFTAGECTVGVLYI